MQQGLIVIQDGASLIRKLCAPKTAAEVLNALQLNGHIFDGDGVQLVGSDSLEAGTIPLSRLMCLQHQPQVRFILFAED